MNQTTPSNPAVGHSDILTEVRGQVGFITLNRP